MGVAKVEFLVFFSPQDYDSNSEVTSHPHTLRMDKDTEAKLLQLYDAVRGMKDRIKSLPEGSAERIKLMTEYTTGKADYNRRKDALQRLKTSMSFVIDCMRY
jgi:hypothetical protein